MARKLSKAMREYFAKIGRKGGRKRLETMTPAERKRRAQKAIKARWSRARKEGGQ